MINKIIYSLILCSIVYSQTYFDRIYGGDAQFGDARSMGLANSYTTTGSSSSIISRNPARISYLSDGETGLMLDMQINSRSYFERRSINIFDTFGDFLNETDYVSNEHNQFYDPLYNSAGFVFSRNVDDKTSFGIGCSLMSLAGFNYAYVEQVMGEEGVADGEEGYKDPFQGFHIYENRGTISIFSLGLGYSHSPYKNSSPIAIGFSMNHILKSNISDYLYVDNATNSQNLDDYDKLASIETADNQYDTPSGKYKTFSLELPFPYSNNSTFVLATESSILIRSNPYSSYNLSNLSGLPWFLEFDQINDQYIFTLNGVEYFKPRKTTYGLRLKKYRTLFVFEINKEFYASFNNNLNNVNEYKVAFEHTFKLGPAIRMGLSYKEPIVGLLNPISKFTLGSHKQFNKRFNIDFALSYFITDYRYDDIFPIAEPLTNNCNDFCDKITESNMSISTTLKWKF